MDNLQLYTEEQLRRDRDSCLRLAQSEQNYSERERREYREQARLLNAELTRREQRRTAI